VKPTTRKYILVEVECSKEVPDLADKVAGRAWPMPGVEGATAILLDSREAYELAKTQRDGHGSN